jgi:SH3-like domain-containing protein
MKIVKPMAAQNTFGRPLMLSLGLILGLSAAAPALAEFRAVQSPAAILYDAPSKQAKKLYVAPRGMPIEVLSILPTWIKIRDQTGDVLWIERSDLGPVKSVLTVAVANVHQTALDTSPLLFQVERGVLLEIAEAPTASTPTWVKVKHVDGSWGYVKLADIYGL